MPYLSSRSTAVTPLIYGIEPAMLRARGASSLQLFSLLTLSPADFERSQELLKCRFTAIAASCLQAANQPPFSTK